MSRGLFPHPNADALDIPAGSSGRLGATLPFPLKAGSFTLTASLRTGSWDDLDGARIDIALPGDHVTHSFAATSATRVGEALTWTFEQPELVFAVSMQVHADRARNGVQLNLPLDLQCDV